MRGSLAKHRALQAGWRCEAALARPHGHYVAVPFHPVGRPDVWVRLLPIYISTERHEPIALGMCSAPPTEGADATGQALYDLVASGGLPSRAALSPDLRAHTLFVCV